MKTNIILILILPFFLLFSCNQNQVGVSKEYYYKHKVSIQDLIETYDSLQLKQDFALGFMDNQRKYYTLQIITDTVRYTFNSDEGNTYVIDNLESIKLTQKDFDEVANKVKKAQGIWIDTEEFYFRKKKHRGIRLSFKAITLNQPFTPQEFYVLIYFKEPLDADISQEELEKYGLTEIAPKYYHTLSNSFR